MTAASSSTPASHANRLLSPLRLRLLGLVAVASFPAALLIARLAADDRHTTLLRTRESALRFVDSAVVEQRDVLRSARQLIQSLASLPEVADGDASVCSHTLKGLFAAFPNYAAMRRISPRLEVECSTEASDTLGATLSDSSLRHALGMNQAEFGYYRVAASGRPFSTLVEPIKDASGRMRFFLTVDVDLSWLTLLSTTISGTRGATVNVVDAQGFLFARTPDREHLIGTRTALNDTYRQMIAQQNGILEGPGLDGRQKLYAFRALPAANEALVLLTVALPISDVYGVANSNLNRNLLVAAVTLVLALMMAWIAADLLVIRDVNALLGATDRIASGDLTARVRSRAGRGELHELAGTFNHMAERLEERRREFLALGDASPDAIVRIDRDMRVDWANDALLSRLGVTLESVVGKPVTDMSADSSVVPLVMQHARDTFEVGDRREVELHATLAGREGWVDLRFVPERDNSGNVTHVMLIARDVTARKHLETHLAQAERLDSIGKLAGSISHDFNNLLTAIIGNTEIALRALEPDHRVRADLTQILDVARRASALTRQLLSFARRQPTAPRVIEVKPFIEEASALIRRLVGESITVELKLDPDAPRIRFDPTHFEQVLVNLTTNARDAMPKGGVFTIATSRVTIPSDSAAGPDAPVPGDYLLLRVTDTGIGMSAAVQERIFEPFFTTKHEREGTGLGLAVTYGVVRQHGGFIEVESAEGEGTTFSIFFPATRENANFSRSQVSADPAPTGRETILLVEDQDPVRNTIARLLRSHGYSVEEARDGVDALRRWSNGDLSAINLVITDLVMPRMGGETLVRELRQELLNVPVLLISGFDERGSARGMLDRGEAAALLEKPFESQPLLRLVRELLDRSVVRVGV